MEDEIPDLVISDVVMPGMSGYELCKAVKADLQLSHIPVVLVTAKVAVENQVQGLREGADAYVTWTTARSCTSSWAPSRRRRTSNPRPSRRATPPS